MDLSSVKTKCSGFVHDYRTFVRELPESFTEIGAMLPSSRYLARAMIEPLLNSRRRVPHPCRILEVGPGTGPFTRRLLKDMGAHDELVVCEINPVFMENLKRSLGQNEEYLRKRDNIHFFCGSVLDLPTAVTEEKFDFIVCSLPFHNFSPEMVSTFLNFFSTVLANDGAFSFFHYAGLRKISGMSPSKEVRCRIKGVDQIISTWCRSMVARGGSVKKRVSMLNLPPAIAITLQRHPYN